MGQAFEGGSIYWTTTTGARTVSGAIRNYYFTFGGETGRLAWPNSDQFSYTANGGGEAQSFQGGSVYSSVTVGTHTVSDAIRARYHLLGGEASPLGWPASETQTLTAHGGGFGQAFQSGSIYSSTWGTYETTGPIHVLYQSIGAETGGLGWPASGVLTVTANGGGYGQAYANGSIYWSAGRGAFAVRGAIREFYFSLGGEAGRLGWPTGVEEVRVA